MPPKAKHSKEDIIKSAIKIVREQGIDALTARNLGKELKSSVCPIFTVFESMEALRREVIAQANDFYLTYTKAEMKKGEYPPYKASGIAYIKFAKEEKELFKLLFMRDRDGEQITESREEIRYVLDIIMENLGLTEDEAFIFHMEQWVYVHGIATMIATSYLNWDMEFVSRALTDCYFGLKSRYESIKSK